MAERGDRAILAVIVAVETVVSEHETRLGLTTDGLSLPARLERVLALQPQDAAKAEAGSTRARQRRGAR